MHGISRCAAIFLLAAAAPLASQETIEPGRSVAGELSETDARTASGEPYDGFVFTAQSGATYYITLTSEAFDAYLRAGPRRGSDCDPCSEDDDGGGGTDARLELQTPTGGQQLVRVSSHEPGRSGRYTLLVKEMWLTYPDTVGFSEPIPGGDPEDEGSTLVPGAATGRLTEDDGVRRYLVRRERPPRRVDLPGHGGRERLTLLMRSAAFDACLRLGRWADGLRQELATGDHASGEHALFAGY